MEWISCKERLPEHGQYVLCLEKYPKGTMFNLLAKPLNRCFIQVAEYGTYGNGFVDIESNLLKYVTHWIPLQQPSEK